MSARIYVWSVLIMAMLWGLIFQGCSGTVDQSFEDGRLYVVNNARPPTIAGGSDYVKKLWVVYEGVKYDLPFNLTNDGTPTGAGAIELTEDPLSGGTIVEVEYFFDHMNAFVESRKITVTIDGNMTIDTYMQDWNISSYGSTVLARVVPGKWEGTTVIRGGSGSG